MFHIFKNKKYERIEELSRRIDMLSNLVLALARIQRIHPKVLHDETLKTSDNSQYLSDIFRGWK